MQPSHSVIISIPGPPKTWPWKQSPILAPQITEKSQKGAQSGSQETPKMTLKPEQRENGKRGLRRQPWRRTRDNVACTKPQESQHSNTLYYTVLCVYHTQRIFFAGRAYTSQGRGWCATVI